ncbi:hypothetical protein [Thorsellia anophelis]|uniref:Uncharacterized protein n=1 Tax=Thorsellia anophelis DSM 18579 TaxID=1123402 RepID=A0A1I0FKI8_9GAMM|nr:hypothetical protein [Thorsellia anophelis]SET58572.1 hypothetical protein SAMN02583745_02799 [Thorsellia anophelis DSM 18579]
MCNTQYNTEQLRFMSWLTSNQDRDIFSTLSSAITINWTRELLSTFKDRWDWYSISQNKSIPWTKELVIEFQKELCWFEGAEFLKIETIINDDDIFELLFNKYRGYFESDIWFYENLNWTVKKIAYYFELIDWEVCALSPNFMTQSEIFETYFNAFKNKSVIWPLDLKDTIRFLEKQRHNLDWDNLSSFDNLPWCDELIEHFKYDWNYTELVKNKKIHWLKEPLYSHILGHISASDYKLTQSVIDEQWFKIILAHTNRELDDDHCFLNSTEMNFDLKSKNESFTQEEFNWMHLSNLRLRDWNIELILNYAECWNWEVLSANPSIKWDEFDISQLAHKLDLIRLLKARPGYVWDANKLLPILVQFPWNEEHFYPCINWTIESIQLFFTDLNWGLLSRYGILNQSILSMFRKELHWKYLCFNYKTVNHQVVYEQFYEYWPIQILSNPHISFSEIDVLRFKASFEQIAYEEGEYELFLSSDQSNGRFKLSIPNIPWSDEVMKTVYKAINGRSLASCNQIQWSLDRLELIKDKDSFLGCKFDFISLEFIDILKLKELDAIKVQ